ncbi:hypothetical protein CAPTEDRAFT_194299 [Capitella teleta]|uniref:TNF family profile domain-containing protein n=1 Tax=Capitella teleta TaxID=283909 RepID=R7UFF4_CAPTE|nr:hypothetical protein CAPTEDRAFT_194299 [Capitella teleta]|eukprot:ELU02508.1 hypothetical protein CAPTEDRAFT_194299 [Capitella teleta]
MVSKATFLLFSLTLVSITTARSTKIVIENNDDHCISCDVLKAAMQLDDEDELRPYRMKKKSTMCCIQTQEQQVDLVDAIVKKNYKRASHAGPVDVLLMHSELTLNRSLLPTLTYYTEVLPSEWHFESDVAFCQSKPANICKDSFKGNSPGQGILIPFDGDYKIRARVAWRGLTQALAETYTSGIYSLEVCVVTRSYPEPVPYEVDHVTKIFPNNTSCLDHERSPCAHASVDFPATLKEGDELLVRVTYKDLLLELDHLSFLEIFGKKNHKRRDKRVLADRPGMPLGHSTQLPCNKDRS